ncbi:hypothetical protein RRG08_019030 [Elysia crispata]|uniref:Uncharacterized protein n=1 Tax=Elysia crispata TaxID=231223 RepID=A0AAE1A4Y1_9GAST|nr:hypothetical protein RRG08_019030 [Elysia crispata]
MSPDVILAREIPQGLSTQSTTSLESQYCVGWKQTGIGEEEEKMTISRTGCDVKSSGPRSAVNGLSVYFGPSDPDGMVQREDRMAAGNQGIVQIPSFRSSVKSMGF